MKLKPIPQNTVVHTPTEEEAKELLAILHENGYKWCGDTSLLDDMENKIAYKIMGNKRVTHQTPKYFMDKGFHILTLADFKRKYCEEEKPQPKFKVGDRVKVVGYQTSCIAIMGAHVGEVGTIIRALGGDENYYKITCDNGCFSWHEDWLEPYAEPETKSTEDMKENKEINKELDLCELLKGHEGEYFYSPVCGTDIELKEVFKPFLVFYLDKDDDCTIECETRGWQRIGTLDDCGTFKSITYPDSACLIFPSRALYEQYPLDPYTAWMKWQEEQKKYILQICYAPLLPDDIKLQAQQTVMANLQFRTLSDRDKTIAEINAIVGKYSMHRGCVPPETHPRCIP